MKRVVFFTLLLTVFFLFNQTTPEERLKSYQLNRQLYSSSPFKNLIWQEKGPYFCGGRIVDIEVDPRNPFSFYVATASGGLFKTDNNATSWVSLFDDQASITIGDIAISPRNPNLIWVGTGEANSSRSSYAGTGVYKSEDGGKTWQHMGLTDTQHIGRIIISPEDENTVYVAAIGHLYTDNEERGVFKTNDGGKSWQKVLYISPKTGVIDLAIDPHNSNILYAAAWQRERKAWNFVEGGAESGIYKSVDAGKSWQKIGNGFPQGEHVGRIGLAIAPSGTNTIYTFLDNQAPRPPEKRANSSGLSAEMFLKMDREQFLKIPPAKLDLFLKENNVPARYNAEMIINMVKNGQATPQMIGQMLLDANRRLFQTNIIGAEVYRSDDGGLNWKKTHRNYIDELVFTYGYYFGQIRVSPDNENTIYLLGVPLLKSEDGGQTFFDISEQGGIYGEEGVHADMHALWINPANSRHLLLGNDGGLNISYDAGKTWQKIANLPLAQCYTVAYDLQTPYRIYTGLQDNGVNVAPSDFVFRGRDNTWKMILGGDGAFVEPDYENPEIVYAAFQFGNLFRLDLKNNSSKNIQPRSTQPTNPYRFNWLTPFILSRFNPRIIYLGANKVLKSIDRGEGWIEISPDLTDAKNTSGDVPYATITALDESPLSPQIIYAGTDDGNVWVTLNGGCSWEKIVNGLPKKWVTRIVASRFKKERVYLTLTGYREDDFNAYLYISEDYGKTWQSIKANLPEEPVNVIREDTKNENILYLGTDLSVYISLNRGQSWYSLQANLPNNAVYDLKVHPLADELIAGTHGRGVFTLKLNQIQLLTPQILQKAFHLLAIKSEKSFQQQRPLTIFDLSFYLGQPAKLTFRLLQNNKLLLEWSKDFPFGLNRWQFNSRIGEKNLPAGQYLLQIIAPSIKIEEKVTIE